MEESAEEKRGIILQEFKLLNTRLIINSQNTFHSLAMVGSASENVEQKQTPPNLVKVGLQTQVTPWRT